jgi:hypothetical protein
MPTNRVHLVITEGTRMPGGCRPSTHRAHFSIVHTSSIHERRTDGS